MSGKKKSGSARAVPRAYGRLTRHERDTVQRMLERRASCREIARELGRSPSTVSAEVASHRFVTAPKARRGERVDASADLSAACPRLAAWPRCCNGCGRYRAIGCKRRPHVFYEARAAQLCADSVLVSSRRGIDADEPAAAARLEAIRDCLRRGAVARADGGAQRRPGGPVAVDHLPLGLGGLRRHDQHGAQAQGRLQAEEARRGPGGDPATPPAGRMPRSSPSGRTRAPRPGRWTPSRGPGRTPPACSRCCTAPAGSSSRCRWRRRPPGASRTPWGASGPSSAPTGTRRVFRAVLTDNGAEFSDEAAIAALLGEGPGETRLFYCDPRRSDQKGACERNHVEIRKLLPKGAGIRFDRLVPADLALAMSHVNSEPRGALGFATPARAFRAMLGEDAAALLDAYGVGDVPIGGTRPDAGAHREGRAQRGAMPRWPSLGEKRNRRTDRPAESGKRCRAAGGAWPPDPSKHISTIPSTGKMAPPGPERGRGGVRLTAGASHQLNVFG